MVEVAPRSGWAVKHTVIPMVSTVTTAYLAFFINIRGEEGTVAAKGKLKVAANTGIRKNKRKIPLPQEKMGKV